MRAEPYICRSNQYSVVTRIKPSPDDLTTARKTVKAAAQQVERRLKDIDALITLSWSHHDLITNPHGVSASARVNEPYTAEIRLSVAGYDETVLKHAFIEHYTYIYEHKQYGPWTSCWEAIRGVGVALSVAEELTGYTDTRTTADLQNVRAQWDAVKALLDKRATPPDSLIDYDATTVNPGIAYTAAKHFTTYLLQDHTVHEVYMMPKQSFIEALNAYFEQRSV